MVSSEMDGSGEARIERGIRPTATASGRRTRAIFNCGTTRSDGSAMRVSRSMRRHKSVRGQMKYWSGMTATRLRKLTVIPLMPSDVGWDATDCVGASLAGGMGLAMFPAKARGVGRSSWTGAGAGASGTSVSSAARVLISGGSLQLLDSGGFLDGGFLLSGSFVGDIIDEIWELRKLGSIEVNLGLVLRLHQINRQRAHNVRQRQYDGVLAVARRKRPALEFLGQQRHQVSQCDGNAAPRQLR